MNEMNHFRVLTRNCPRQKSIPCHPRRNLNFLVKIKYVKDQKKKWSSNEKNCPVLEISASTKKFSVSNIENPHQLENFPRPAPKPSEMPISTTDFAEMGMILSNLMSCSGRIFSGQSSRPCDKSSKHFS
jgi:hypothetical protein